jgi:hypothetical protein
MSKFEKRRVVSAPASVSPTICEAGTPADQYVWDTGRRPRQDPFFAVSSIVMELPRMSFPVDDDEGRVSITF